MVPAAMCGMIDMPVLPHPLPLQVSWRWVHTLVTRYQ